VLQLHACGLLIHQRRRASTRRLDMSPLHSTIAEFGDSRCTQCGDRHLLSFFFLSFVTIFLMFVRFSADKDTAHSGDQSVMSTADTAVRLKKNKTILDSIALIMFLMLLYDLVCSIAQRFLARDRHAAQPTDACCSLEALEPHRTPRWPCSTHQWDRQHQPAAAAGAHTAVSGGRSRGRSDNPAKRERKWDSMKEVCLGDTILDLGFTQM